jgi:hypothetical protein
MAATVSGLSWKWIALMALVPLPIGLLVAYPIWRTREFILGNVAGTIVIFGSALALILRESVVLDRVTRACLDAGYTCWPEPSGFARYATYAFIGAFEVFALFSLSLRVERNIRRQGYAPEWR